MVSPPSSMDESLNLLVLVCINDVNVSLNCPVLHLKSPGSSTLSFQASMRRLVGPPSKMAGSLYLLAPVLVCLNAIVSCPRFSQPHLKYSGSSTLNSVSCIWNSESEILPRLFNLQFFFIIALILHFLSLSFSCSSRTPSYNRTKKSYLGRSLG